MEAYDVKDDSFREVAVAAITNKAHLKDCAIRHRHLVEWLE